MKLWPWHTTKVRGNTLTIFRYGLIDEIKTSEASSSDENYLRLSPEVFKEHLFSLFNHAFKPISLEAYKITTQGSGENYFSIAFIGDYTANRSAYEFLEALGVPYYVFSYACNFGDVPNPILNNLTLDNIKKLEEKGIQDKLLYLGDTSEESLIKAKSLEVILKNTPARFRYFYSPDYINPALYYILKHKNYLYALSSREGYVCGDFDQFNGLIPLNYDLPTVNATQYSAEEFENYLLSNSYR